MTLPEIFLQRLARIIPASHFDSVVASFGMEKPACFRLNTLADSTANILDALQLLNLPLEPIVWLRDAHDNPLAYQTPRCHRDALTHSAIVDAGKIYLQNLSSMLAPLILDPQPGETILDLAAAPGGKTIQIAQQMQNQGVLSAVEVVRNRMFKLQANLKRCHVAIAKTYLTDGRTVGQKTPARFDRVLLDAPCSSEARFRSGDPDSWETWSLRKLRETSRKQIGLLKAAIHAVKVGGVVLYCTCSLAPEENEQVVTKVLKKFGTKIELEPIRLPIKNWIPGLTEFESKAFDPRVQHCVRVLPDGLHDAFFMALIRKNGQDA